MTKYHTDVILSSLCDSITQTWFSLNCGVVVVRPRNIVNRPQAKNSELYNVLKKVWNKKKDEIKICILDVGVVLWNPLVLITYPKSISLHPQFCIQNHPISILKSHLSFLNSSSSTRLPPSLGKGSKTKRALKVWRTLQTRIQAERVPHPKIEPFP